MAVALLLVGCGVPAIASQSSAILPLDAPEAASQPAEKLALDTPIAETVTLTVWDQFQRDTESAVMDELNAEFEAAHPGVKIKRVVKSFDELKATATSALRDPDGPDVIQVNQGADMRAAVQDGLLLSLTPFMTQYQWAQRFSASILARNSFTGDGVRFGSGNLYGVSPTAEVVGVYYNKAKFEKLGLKIPRTFAEFEVLLAQARTAGETPIVLGNVERWPGLQIFSAIEHVLLPDRTWLDSFVYGQDTVSFDIPENVQAAAKLQKWLMAGYFNDGFSGMGYEDSWKLFAEGQGLMMLTGSWLSAELVKTGGEKFGFFLLPPLEQAGRPLAIGGVGVPFCIRNGTKNAFLAAEYLDWMISPHAGELWLERGLLPAVPVHLSKLPTGTLLGDIVSAYDVMSTADAVGHYIDWASPDMYNVLGAATQDLMSLKTTPQEFVATVQAEYAKGP
jgi:raffinose/stachyose/melibiose transport system substrate-binding protein